MKAIQANELRQGNYIKTEYGMLTAHGSIITDISNGSIIAMPIPLTPEILEKAGFKFDTIPFFERDGRGYKLIHSGNVFAFRNEVSETKQGLQIELKMCVPLLTCSINHVHQLQNLIFSMTGTELNIEL